VLRTHCQTSGWSLTEQDVFNNVARTTIEAMAAVLGGTQSLHTNARRGDRAADRFLRAHRPQHPAHPAEESGVTHVIDPLGRQLLRRAPDQRARRPALGHIEEVEALGGMAKAIERRPAQARIEEASAAHAGAHRPRHPGVVGVNRYRLDDEIPTC
jgi:methylmalonyl-CoA mutase